MEVVVRVLSMVCVQHGVFYQSSRAGILSFDGENVVNLFIFTAAVCLILIITCLLTFRFISDESPYDDLEPHEEVEVLYWPDGTWCYRWELEQMGHMSDDCAEWKVPVYFDYIDIEREVNKLNGASK